MSYLLLWEGILDYCQEFYGLLPVLIVFNGVHPFLVAGCGKGFLYFKKDSPILKLYNIPSLSL